MLEHLMTWPIGVWITVTTVLIAIIGGALKLEGHRVFAPKSLSGDVDKLGNKVQGHDTRIEVIEKDNVHQDKILEEGVVKPLARMATQLDNLTAGQTKAEVAIAKVQEAQKGMGKSIDTLRTDFQALRDK